MVDKEAIDALCERLKQIKSAFRPMHGTTDMIRANAVPPNLRYEVAKLYDEHGGIDIIMNLTRVGYTTIKNWHRDY
jgi:hypothetical protein